MIRAPGFWQGGGLAAGLLAPLEIVTRYATARRVARPGWRAPVPVVCCGNASVGGTGKTILALDLAHRLQERGAAVHFVTRGHGGRERGPKLVLPDVDDAEAVGDEPLLLAGVAPTWVARDRAAGARAAFAAGASLILMDDGLQNPSLAKDLSLLVVDGAVGFGNGRLLPAGPLREPVAAAIARCQAAVLIGEDTCGALSVLDGLPTLRAELVQGPIPSGRVLAFAGIGRPEKFRTTLLATGCEVIDLVAFADHHPFHRSEIEALLRRAEALGARLVTTTKDAMRIAPNLRRHIIVVDVRLVWHEIAVLDKLLSGL
jgi:tetraacyldisaccharide 4'-kinase